MPDSYLQVPPDSTGKKLRHRQRVVGADTVYEQGVFQSALPTWYALADAVAFAANKQMISIVNESGSGVVLELRKLFLIDVQLSTVTGVAVRQDVKKATAHSGGTAITCQAADSASAALPSQITVRTGATSVSEGAILFPIGFANDEIGATQAFPGTALLAGYNWLIEGPEVQGLRLREGDGLTVKNITSSTVGSFSYLLVFTVDV